MPALSRPSRSKLESTIGKARRVAEKAARTELERLGVGEAAPPAYLSSEERKLRSRLRAHGRQLGDSLLQEPKSAQEIGHLAAEVAYEHWHRMLFARFLAENGLLVHPEHKVPVSLDDCEELAREEEREGRASASRWDLAARFASAILPQIFRKDSPSLSVLLAPDERTELESLLASLPPETFMADDSLGWVYQFWQGEAKDAINKSERKIGANELPSVTQLFTEDYMVSFLLDNSLGAWWAGKRLSQEELNSIHHGGTEGTEEARREIERGLRKKIALPGLPFDYLRFVKDDEEGWKPAAGVFETWPKSAKEIKYLDPCCGSGHFLTAGFRYLSAMRMAEEALDARAAGDAVLRDNLFGLELDPRCVEIAAFSVAFEAWRSGGGHRELPELHIACSGLAPRTSKEEWLRVADEAGGMISGGDTGLFPDPNKASLWQSALHSGMEALYNLFADAPTLGSLIDPTAIEGTLFSGAFDQTAELLAAALKKESRGEELRETGVAAQGIAKAASLLAGRYHLVATNVPYLSRGKQDEKLRKHCEEKHDEAKNDLATVFLERCLRFCATGGSASVVLPQNWLFLTSYQKFRRTLLAEQSWNILARLGENGFDSSAAAGAFTVLIGISRGGKGPGGKASETHSFAAVDASEPREPLEKAKLICDGEIRVLGQKGQLGNPDARVVISTESTAYRLDVCMSNHQGLSTGDNPRFRIQHWEVNPVPASWEYEQSTVEDVLLYGGRAGLLLWEKGDGQLKKFGRENVASLHNVDSRGKEAWRKKGIAVSQMRDLPCTVFSGNKFDTNVATLIPSIPTHLPAIWCFCSSPQYNEEVRKIDQKLNVTNATLVKVPFDLEHWTKVATERYPNGLPAPFSDDPTQWIFHGHPAGSVIWNEAGKRLEKGKLRRDTTVLQVAVVRLLGYRWPAELDASMELSAESRELVAACDGLLPFADEDGIVCVPSVSKEKPAADRLVALLAAAYGREWSTGVHDELLAACDWTGKDLESWLRDAFFEQHCKRFGHRPFVWQVWDGQRDGFSALVNYHGLSKARLEKLIYVYLGDWISTQEEGVRKNSTGASLRLAAARELKGKLEAILAGEKPYDIFVRWKPLKEQPLGWDPDINDGVRLNIRPFMTAGVLRVNKPPKLNIKWDVDRGKDVESAPWYPVDKGMRVNDHHTSLEEKRKARGMMN